MSDTDASPRPPADGDSRRRRVADSGAARETPPPLPPAAIPPPPLPPAATEAPSLDVAPVTEDSHLPGEHRGGFTRLPTAPVGIPAPVTEPEEMLLPSAQWVFPEPAGPQRGVAAWALVAAVLGLVVSMFVGWGFPIGLVGIVTAIIALRRPLESRQMAVWALVLSVVSVIYSAGWLLWAANRADLLG